LKVTLPRNLADNQQALFVVLNYGSQDELVSYLQTEHEEELNSGRLVCYSHFDSARFRMAHAKNMAHRLGVLEGADLLVNIDADNLTGIGVDDFIGEQFEKQGDKIFLWARMVPGEMVRGISGRIAISKSSFWKSGGYDETKFDTWGSDDKDLNLRLRQLGYEGVEIDPVYLTGVPHNDKIRFKEYPYIAQTTVDESLVVDRSTVTQGVANSGVFGCGTVFRNFDFDELIHLKPVPTRIFGIGMHKTGTTSLHTALSLLGYESWHWSSAHVAKAIWREMNEIGRSLTLEKYYALCDLPIPLLYKKLDAAYPGSKFILTMRHERKWLEATMRHFSTAFNKWRSGWNEDPFTNRIHEVLYGRTSFDPDIFLERYRRHNAEVREYFKYRPRDLLMMNIDQEDGWERLCRFLSCRVPDGVGYPAVNVGE
jgi:hypothetical protein